MKKAFIFWRSFAGAKAGMVRSWAYNLAGDRILAYPSEVGEEHPEVSHIVREVYPEPFQCELVALVEREGRNGDSYYYVAFPLDPRPLDLPGITEPCTIRQTEPLGGSLVDTLPLGAVRRVRIFRGSEKSPYMREIKGVIPWSKGLNEMLLSAGVPCKIVYRMARDNRFVGYAYPAAGMEKELRRSCLPRKISIAFGMQGEEAGRYGLVVSSMTLPGQRNVVLTARSTGKVLKARVSKGYLKGIVAGEEYEGVLLGEGTGDPVPQFVIDQYIHRPA